MTDSADKQTAYPADEAERLSERRKEAASIMIDAIFSAGRSLSEKYGDLPGYVITNAMGAVMTSAAQTSACGDIEIFRIIRDNTLAMLSRQFDLAEENMVCATCETTETRQ